MSRLLALAALLAAGPAFAHYAPGALAIEGPVEVERDKLVRLKATGVDPKAGLVWRVYPRGQIDRADTASDRDFQFVAPPGVYEVELLAVTVDKDGRVRVDESLHTVRVKAGGEKPPPDKPKDPPTDPVPGPGGKLYFMVVRPDGPASPAFTKVMADPAWTQILAAGHLVKDKTSSEARPWWSEPVSQPVVVTLRFRPDGKQVSIARRAVPLPTTSAGILKLTEGL